MPYARCSLLAISLCPVTAVADPVAELPPIVISAGRTEAHVVDLPAGIAVIDRPEIERSAPIHAADLLRGRAGVDVRDPYGDGSRAVVDMRGFGPTAASNTLILMDGRRLNNGSDIAAPDLSTIDVDNLERVEILQGSAGTLFGDQAVGGLVNLISRRPDRFDAWARAGGGSYSGYRLDGYASERLASGLGYRLSAGKGQSDNYRDQNASDRDRASLFLDYDLDAGSLFLEQEFVREELELPGSLFREELAADRRQSAGAYQGDFSDTQTLVSRLGLRHTLADTSSVEAELTYRDNDRRFQTSFRAFPGSPSTQKRRVWGFNPRLTGMAGVASADLRWTLGADLETTDYALRTAFGPQTTDQYAWGVYAQLTASLAKGWRTTVGLRHAAVSNDIDNNSESIDIDDDLTVGSAGLAFEPAPGWRWFARWDQNFRFAKVDEHTNVISGQPAGLDTQTGDSYEFGLRLHRGTFSGMAMVYRLALDDEISFDSSTFFNVNLDRTRRSGGLLDWAWEPLRDWGVGGSYTYVDPQITAGPFAGNRLPLVPRHSGRLYLNYGAASGLGLYGEALWVGERVLGGDFDNRFDALGGYAVVNLVGRYDAGPWRLTLRVNNVLDKRYSDTGAVGFDETFALRDAYFPSPERNFWLSARYDFAD
jgi:iron complex outermembrane receptor protein